MYTKSSQSPEIVRWTDSLRRLKPQVYSKRVSPFNSSAAIEKKKAIITPNKKRSSSIKVALFQKALFNFGQKQEQQREKQKEEEEQEKEQGQEEQELSTQENNTPELSIEDASSASSSCSSSYISSLSDEDDYSINVDEVVQQLLHDDNGIDLNTDDDYDDDIVEQALTRIMTSRNKSQTCPDLTFTSEEQDIDRPLPALPSEVDSEDILSKSVELFSNKNNRLLQRYTSTSKLTRAAASKGQIQLKRAVTWLGLPVQKMLASSPIQNIGLKMSQTSAALAGNALFMSKNNVPALSLSSSTLSTTASKKIGENEDIIQPHEQPFTKELIYGTDSDHFAFLRNQLEQKSISNLQKKNSIIANKKTLVTPKRIMYCRVMQIINLASTRDCDYELFIQLNNVTMATKRGVLRKIEKSVSADRPQEEAMAFEVEEPFSLNFIVAARHTNTVLRDGLAKMGIWPINTASQKPTPSNNELPVAGFACLNFENKMDVLDQGVSRFRLTKPVDKSSNRWLNIELLIDIKIEEVLPAVVNRFPWSYTTNEHSAAVSYHSCEDIICDARELVLSQSHCRRGDYLTFYTRRMAHPIWKRYWVTLEENHLVLHDFTYKDAKEPLNIIPLPPLQAVSKPTVDDCENVGVARKTGIILQFDRSKAMLTELVRLDSDEGLEGRTYIYGDNEQNTIHWRNALSAYVNNEERKSSAIEDGVDLRFLW